VRAHSPVLTVVVLVGEVLFVVGEERVQLQALLEVFDCFEATNVLEEVKVAVSVDAGADQSVPVDALELDVGVVDLEVEGEGLGEVDVGTLDGVHILSCSFKLVELEVFGEHFHFNQLIIIMSLTHSTPSITLLLHWTHCHFCQLLLLIACSLGLLLASRSSLQRFVVQHNQ
jgi:hypothetical protein